MKNTFPPSQRKLAAAILRARRAQFIGIEYIDAKGNYTKRAVQVRVDLQAAHEKRGGFTGAGSWVSHARHIGDLLELAVSPKDGGLVLRALCNLRKFPRCFRLDRIQSVRGLSEFDAKAEGLV